MAVHVLAVLAYKEGDRVTSATLAGSVNTNPVIVRRLLLSLQKARLVETCKGAGSGSRLSRSPRRGCRIHCQAGAQAQRRLPGGPLHSGSPVQTVCLRPERHGKGSGENHAGRRDRRGEGVRRLRWKKSRLTVSFFVRVCNHSSYI